MFTRLANTRVQKDVELGAPIIKLQSNNKIVFSIEAITKLKIDEKDRFDVLKNENTGRFYIANLGKKEKEGRELSSTRSVTHERINKELGGRGKVYIITDKIVDFDDLDWFELELVETEKESIKETVKDTELV